MALVSPGTQITVTDESQYISNAVGTTPLVVLATAQDKTLNGAYCSGTSLANAGALQIFNSQRELSTAMGYPTFQLSSAGTPLHGDETNEYGLMAAYSALGVNNQLMLIRANVDLNQLQGTSVRPSAAVADQTNWFDTADSTWGIYQWSADSQSFTLQQPIIITSNSQTTLTTQGNLGSSVVTPIQTIGNVGSYAVVATTNSNRIFYKAGTNIGSINPNGLNNTWVAVGTPNWKASNPAVKGTATNPTLITGGNLAINGNVVTLSGTTLSAFAANINSAAIPGITADVLNNQLALYTNGNSTSGGYNTTVDGKIVITTAYNGTGNTTLISNVGLTTGTYYNAPAYQYNSFAGVPYWTTNDTTPEPNGSVWFKVGATGGGSNFVVKQYNATTQLWNSLAVNSYSGEFSAIYGLDPIGGGINIPIGTVYALYQSSNLGAYTLKVRSVSGAVASTGTATTSPPFVNGNTFQLQVTRPGSANGTLYTLTMAGTGLSDFVNTVNSAGIPNILASLSSSGAITLTHLTGGDIQLIQVTGQDNFALKAGFISYSNGVYSVPSTVANGIVNTTGTTFIISGFSFLTYTYSNTQPVADPANGTYWYYSDPTVVDVMINTGTAWRGYKNVSSDLRGYNLALTDSNGVIVSASTPTTQYAGTALATGDLWLNTSNLENWPNLNRWNGSSWIAIDSTDQISGNGILFADARWDNSGTTDPASDTEVSTQTLLTSDYLDLDAPNPALYPRGMLLLNTRRSGYNVKQYITNYFNTTVDNVAAWNVGTTYVQGAKVYSGSTIYVSLLNNNTGNTPSTATTYWSPLVHSAWVTASGLKNTGAPYAGHQAQRQVVVAAMNAAIESNTEIREDQFKFSLICAPGYPELISNMVSLNNDRANTAFVIGDTPLDLSTNPVDLINWSNDTNGDGLATADPYLAVYYPSGLSTDLGGNTIMVPPSHMALRTYLYNDNVAYQWFAPAGTRRGLVSNATDLGYLDRMTGSFVRTGVAQGLRDTLYQNKINPITIIPGIGLVVWGQKTRDPNTESMDRVNVSRLVNYIRTIFASAGNAFLFEPNDKITRDQFAAILNRALNDLVAKRGIYDYLVVCDTTNNTPDRIANNQLYADVAIEPMKDVEFIYIPIRLYNPGDIAKLGGK